MNTLNPSDLNNFKDMNTLLTLLELLENYKEESVHKEKLKNKLKELIKELLEETLYGLRLIAATES